MLRGLSIPAALVGAALAGVAAASALTSSSAVSQTPVPRDELPAQTDELGAQAADPRGGPPWAVRILDGDAGSRCIAAVRTQDGVAGRVDEAGELVPTPALRAGSCADPRSAPLQLAVARVAGAGASGPRSVLLAVAGPNVTGVLVIGPDGPRAVKLGASRSFLVVHEGLAPPDSWTVTVTLSDGLPRIYHL